MARSAPRRRRLRPESALDARGMVPGGQGVEPEPPGPLEERPNLMWRLHSIHGFGVRPAAWSVDVGRDHRCLEGVGEVEDVMVEHRAGRRPGGRRRRRPPSSTRCRTRRPTASGWRPRRRARTRPATAAATEESTPPDMATRTRTTHRSRGRSRLRTATGVDRASELFDHLGDHRWSTSIVGVGGGVPEGEPDGRAWPRPTLRPMASSTWLGSRAPLAHAAPGRRADTAVVVEEHEELLLVDTGDDGGGSCVGDLPPGGRASTDPGPRHPGLHHAVDRRPRARRRAGPAVRRTRGPRCRARSSTATRKAAAMPTMPATSWVPGRRPRSCAPPWSTGPSGAPRPDHERAHPLRAPELVGAHRHQVGRRRERRPRPASPRRRRRRCAATARGRARGRARPPRPGAGPCPPRCWRA